MRTPKPQWAMLWTGVIAASLVSAVSAKDELPKAVRAVLANESEESQSSWNRRQQLGEELVKAKASDEELYWNVGYVKVNGKWLPFEESTSPEPMTGNGREYLDRREKAEHTWQSQSALADWCSKHSMGEQAQAHNYHALMSAPKDADLSKQYQRMGYVRFGSHWLSRQEAVEAQRDLMEYLDQLETGTPAASRFADELDAGRYSEASRRDRLKQLADSKMIAALELVLASRSELCGQAAVEALRQIPTYQASQALGRIAAYSPWLFVRDSAIDSLKDRRCEDFIPQWLGMMRMPITTEFQRATWGSHHGILCLFRSEREVEIDVGQLLVWVPPNPELLLPRGRNRRAVFLHSYQTQVSAALRQRRHKIESASFLQNDLADELNGRVVAALRQTTQQNLAESPQTWWDWWREQSALTKIPSNAKKVVIVKEDQPLIVRPRTPPIQFTGMSCLVAGTSIWTERGLVAVERIQPGDRVLSKNFETGELAYKVVLHTTVREPFPTRKFVVGDETTQATEGHHFWVSGRGWTKTRELAAEQPLHTPIGIARISSTEPAEPAPTYNLVVADFHTYFVGKSGILSNDVLPPKPTNKVVPGLNDE